VTAFGYQGSIQGLEAHLLLVLSGTLVIDTMFSGLNAAQTALWLAAALILGALTAGAWARLTRSRRPVRPPHPRATMTEAERMNWRMPPLALLKPVQWSAGTKLAMLVLRAYLVISVLLLIVKAIRIGQG